MRHDPARRSGGRRKNKRLTIERRLEKMSQQLDHLTASVAAEKTADASAIALIQGLSDQLKAALSQPDPSGAIEQLASDLDASQQALAAAVAANTAATPAQPAPAADQASDQSASPALDQTQPDSGGASVGG